MLAEMSVTDTCIHEQCQAIFFYFENDYSGSPHVPFKVGAALNAGLFVRCLRLYGNSRS